MKKKWLDPQLNELGVSLTKDDTIVACPEDIVDELFFPGFNPEPQKKCSLPGCDHRAAKGSERCRCHQSSGEVTERPYPTEPALPTLS